MKTILKITLIGMILLECLIASSNNNPKTRDPFHLIVEGKFLAEKNVHYTVYKLNSKGVFVSESHNKGKKYYSVMCDVGSKYLIRFQDKKHNVKFLMLDVTRHGTFTVDVDFSRSYDAVLQFTKNGYSITPLTNSMLQLTVK